MSPFLSLRNLLCAGYSKNAQSRQWGAIAIYPSLLVLLGTSIATAVLFFRGTAPF